jgi:hypothetical protein
MAHYKKREGFLSRIRFFLAALSVFVIANGNARSNESPEPKASAPNYTALWWNAQESGWGLNLNHQGDTLFATLFTYDSAGAPIWLVMSNGVLQSDNVSFAGDLYRTNGTPFSADVFVPLTSDGLTKVGTMSVSFRSEREGTLSYSYLGRTVTKAISPQVFGRERSICSATTDSRLPLTNYQDLWWNPAESGWGMNITHQDDILFATLFIYGSNGSPSWYVMSGGTRQSDGSFAGDLFATRGPAFDSQPFVPISGSDLRKVGTLSLRFRDGMNGVMSYGIDGVNVNKVITRQEFSNRTIKCVSESVAAAKAELCVAQSSLFSNSCSPVAVPYATSGVMSSTVLGASEVNVLTLTLTARNGPLTITEIVAVDDANAVSPRMEGIPSSLQVSAGQSVTIRLQSPLTHGRTANLRYRLSANSEVVFDVRMTLRTN